jgi:serine/threonine protein phosphatase PrpC
LIAVFDGHARLGDHISQYAVTELPKVLAKKLDTIDLTKENHNDLDDDTTSVKHALIDTFIEIDRTCPGEISGGCTASVVLQRHSPLAVLVMFSLDDALSMKGVHDP